MYPPPRTASLNLQILFLATVEPFLVKGQGFNSGLLIFFKVKVDGGENLPLRDTSSGENEVFKA